tara:strand:+ start:300 stop:527 length:228 start_codon:yes stop_codon:yes gene_type:complete
MNRVELVKCIKERGWKHQVAFSAKRIYYLVSGEHEGRPFHYHAPIPFNFEHEHTYFWRGLLGYLSMRFVAENSAG